MSGHGNPHSNKVLNDYCNKVEVGVSEEWKKYSLAHNWAQSNS